MTLGHCGALYDRLAVPERSFPFHESRPPCQCEGGVNTVSGVARAGMGAEMYLNTAKNNRVRAAADGLKSR